MFNLDQLAGVADARPGVDEAGGAPVRRGAGDGAQDDGAGPNPLAKNPPLYYAYQVVPYYVGSLGDMFWDRLIVMRLASGLLSSCSRSSSLVRGGRALRRRSGRG